MLDSPGPSITPGRGEKKRAVSGSTDLVIKRFNRRLEYASVLRDYECKVGKLRICEID